jgi:hypothetical protein
MPSAVEEPEEDPLKTTPPHPKSPKQAKQITMIAVAR